MEFFKLVFFDYYPIFCDSQLTAVHVKNSKPYRYISNEKYALEKDHCLNLLPNVLFPDDRCVQIIIY
ncbi:hypothetical protein T09_10827 [Trichinella sp. T9]|nr:hypothetical protein T09_10827 [Trichinella sp. T9]